MFFGPRECDSVESGPKNHLVSPLATDRFEVVAAVESVSIRLPLLADSGHVEEPRLRADQRTVGVT